MSVVGRAEHKKVAFEMARKSLAWSSGPQEKLSGEIVYWEPEADSEAEWLGGAFVSQLREAGVKVSPCDGKKVPKGAALVLGCFLSPRAYTGKINFDKKTASQIGKLLKSASKSLIVSFGSPFVFESFAAGGLCAFSCSEAAQHAAAAALLGKIKVDGRMPVALNSAR
jgi:hypothetical protein